MGSALHWRQLLSKPATYGKVLLWRTQDRTRLNCLKPDLSPQGPSFIIRILAFTLREPPGNPVRFNPPQFLLLQITWTTLRLARKRLA